MKRVLDHIASVQGHVAGILFLLVFAINTMEIISRTFFNHSFLWVSDISTICIVWMIFLGMAIGVYHREHIRMEILLAKFPPKVRCVVEIAITLITFAFFIMLFVTGLETAAQKKALIFPSIQWSLLWAYSALPVFALSSAVFMIPELLDLFHGKVEELQPEAADVRFL